MPSHAAQGLAHAGQAGWRCPVHAPSGAVLRAVLCAALLACSTPALAAPAPWHWWKSRLDGRIYCAQTSPGSGWVRIAGPFDNAQCRKHDDGKAEPAPPRVPRAGARGG